MEKGFISINNFANVKLLSKVIPKNIRIFLIRQYIFNKVDKRLIILIKFPPFS